jgi:hypothetical protein
MAGGIFGSSIIDRFFNGGSSNSVLDYNQVVDAITVSVLKSCDDDESEQPASKESGVVDDSDQQKNFKRTRVAMLAVGILFVLGFGFVMGYSLASVH